MIIRKTFSQFMSEASPTLDDLRTASAKATMAGPSKEAQALMSTRAKNLLGQSRLDAGIKAQQGVETMKSQIPSYIPPRPSTPTPTAPLPRPSTTAPTAPPPPAQPKVPVLNQQQQDLYKQAYQNRNNPFAKGRIKSEFSKLTPDQQQAFRDYAKEQGHDWGNLI
jgi:hypothetical protein